LYTTSFSQEAIYDDSNTDLILTKCDITVQTILNSAYAGTLGVAGGDPATLMNNIRQQLLTPRKAFIFSVGGVNLLPATAGNNGPVDAKNGPMPQYCNLTQLTRTTFLMNYRIVAHYWGGTGTGPVLSDRWTDNMEYDGAMYSTRTRQGKIIIRSDNAQGLTPDQLRPFFATVGVPDGFLRKSSRYTVAPDGLSLGYAIVDKEVFKNPPLGAMEAEGEYTETTTHLGHMRHGHCRVRLKGSKLQDQGKLIDAALSIVARKLGILGAQLALQGIGNGKAVIGFAAIESSSIRVGLYDNYVEVSMQAKMAPRPGKAQNSGAAGLNYSSFTTTPLSDPSQPPTYFPYGTAPVLLQAAAYYDPNLQAELNPVTGQMSAGNVPGTGG